MVTIQGLDILDLKSLNKELVTCRYKSDRIINLKLTSIYRSSRRRSAIASSTLWQISATRSTNLRHYSSHILEAKREGFDKVLPLLHSACIGRVLGCAQFNSLSLDIHANLKFEMLDQRRIYSRPIRLERCHPMRRDRNFSGFNSCDGILQTLSFWFEQASI
jgi:hypothetical protein